jgi:hypothetical protein
VVGTVAQLIVEIIVNHAKEGGTAQSIIRLSPCSVLLAK